MSLSVLARRALERYLDDVAASSVTRESSPGGCCGTLGAVSPGPPAELSLEVRLALAGLDLVPRSGRATSQRLGATCARP